MRGSRKDEVIKNIETQRSYKMTVNLDNLKFLKTFLSSGLKIVCSFGKVDQNVFKKTPTRAPQCIITSLFLANG